MATDSKLAASQAPADQVRKRRVLLILPDLRGGGAERTSLNVRSALAGGPLDVEIVLMDPSGEYLEKAGHHDWILPPGEWLRTFALRLPPESPQRGLLQLPRLMGLLIADKPDVIMTSMAEISIPMRVALALLPRRLRPFWIVRDGNNVKLVIHQSYPEPMMKRLIEALYRWTYRAADVVLVPSQGVGRCLEEDYGIDHDLIQVIGNPADISRVRERAAETPEITLPDRYIVAVGRLAHQKAVDVMLHALSQLDDRDVSLVVCGAGPDLENLKGLAAELGLSDRVVFAGFQSNPWAIMARAAAFCLPSRWEGFGHVVVEAFACEVPVVISDCDFGPDEIVRDGRDGWVVPTDDASALAAALDEVLANPDMAKQRVAEGRKRAEAFDIAPIAAAYERLFASGEAYSAEPGSPKNPLDPS